VTILHSYTFICDRCGEREAWTEADAREAGRVERYPKGWEDLDCFPNFPKSTGKISGLCCPKCVEGYDALRLEVDEKYRDFFRVLIVKARVSPKMTTPKEVRDNAMQRAVDAVNKVVDREKRGNIGDYRNLT